MHTSYLPTGQRSRLKEAIQMQISSDINPRRRRDNQFFLEGKYDVGQGSHEHQGWKRRKVKRDRDGKHYPIMLHISKRTSITLQGKYLSSNFHFSFDMLRIMR